MEESVEVKAYNAMIAVLEKLDLFLDDEARDRIDEIAAYVAGHPNNEDSNE